MRPVARAVAASALALPFAAAAATLSAPMQILGVEIDENNTINVRLSANTECGSTLAAVPRSMLDLVLFAYSGAREVRVAVTSCDFNRKGLVTRLAVGNY